MGCLLHSWIELGHSVGGSRHSARLEMCVRCKKKRVDRYGHKFTEEQWADVAAEIEALEAANTKAMLDKR